MQKQNQKGLFNKEEEKLKENLFTKEWILCSHYHQFYICKNINLIEELYYEKQTKTPIEFHCIFDLNKFEFVGHEVKTNELPKTELEKIENESIEIHKLLIEIIKQIYEGLQHQYKFYTNYYMNVLNNDLYEFKTKKELKLKLIPKSKLKWLTYEYYSFIKYSELCEQYFNPDKAWEIQPDMEDFYYCGLQEILDWLMSYKPSMFNTMGAIYHIMNADLDWDEDYKGLEDYTAEDEEELGEFFFGANDRLY